MIKISELTENLKIVLPKFHESLKKFENDYAKRIEKYYMDIVKESEKFNTTREYFESKFGKNYIQSKQYYDSPHYELQRFTLFKKQNISKWLSEKINTQIKLNRRNLEQTIYKYLSNVDNIIQTNAKSVNLGTVGFEGIWHIKTIDDEIRFSVQAIYAGGYNIQKLHIRYIADIKSLIKNVPIKSILSKKIQKKSSVEKEQKRKEVNKRREEKKKLQWIKRLLQIIRELKHKYGHVLMALQFRQTGVVNDSEAGIKRWTDEALILQVEYYKYYSDKSERNLGNIENAKLRAEHNQKAKSKYNKNELMDLATKGKLDYLVNWNKINKFRL